jgi:hypothetical protein
MVGCSFLVSCCHSPVNSSAAVLISDTVLFLCAVLVVV